MNPDRDEILRALERVIDPELRQPVTELDMVRDVEIALLAPDPALGTPPNGVSWTAGGLAINVEIPDTSRTFELEENYPWAVVEMRVMVKTHPRTTAP